MTPFVSFPGGISVFTARKGSKSAYVLGSKSAFFCTLVDTDIIGGGLARRGGTPWGEAIYRVLALLGVLGGVEKGCFGGPGGVEMAKIPIFDPFLDPFFEVREGPRGVLSSKGAFLGPLFGPFFRGVKKGVQKGGQKRGQNVQISSFWTFSCINPLFLSKIDIFGKKRGPFFQKGAKST